MPSQPFMICPSCRNEREANRTNGIMRPHKRWDAKLQEMVQCRGGKGIPRQKASR